MTAQSLQLLIVQRLKGIKIDKQMLKEYLAYFCVAGISLSYLFRPQGLRGSPPNPAMFWDCTLEVQLTDLVVVNCLCRSSSQGGNEKDIFLVERSRLEQQVGGSNPPSDTYRKHHFSIHDKIMCIGNGTFLYVSFYGGVAQWLLQLT